MSTIENLPATFTHRVEDPWKNFLNQQKARDVLECGALEMTMVSVSDTVRRSLQVLAKKKISSAPVISQDGIVGIVDVLDVLVFAIGVIGDTKKPISNLEQKFQWGLDAFERPVTDVMNASRRYVWHVVSEDTPLFNVIKVLANPDAHRVLVYQARDPKSFIGIITQSAMIEYLNKNKVHVDDRLKCKVKELWPESKPVFTVSYNESMLDAFQKIVQARVSAVAVADNKGTLVGNISASDIKHVGLETCAFESMHRLLVELNQQIGNFLGIFGREEAVCPSISQTFGQNKKMPEFKLITVSMDDPLDKVLELLSTTYNVSSLGKTHIHRVYVQDEQKKPLRAISLSDVIAQFVM